MTFVAIVLTISSNPLLSLFLFGTESIEYLWTDVLFTHYAMILEKCSQFMWSGDPLNFGIYKSGILLCKTFIFFHNYVKQYTTIHSYQQLSRIIHYYRKVSITIYNYLQLSTTIEKKPQL